jgi:long-chain fatty acid transport protein
VDTSIEFLQIMPSLSYMLSDQLSVGLGPTLTLGRIVSDPFVLAAPDDADGSGMPRYPMGSGARMAWGGGFQVSTYYRPDPCYSFGATFRSPQWMDRFDNLSEDENGLPRVVSTEFDLPMVLSVGTAYHGIPDSVLALDVRYIGNAQADGFGDAGFNPDGSLAGLGYGDCYMVAAGLRRRLSEWLSVGAGYTFCSNPLSDSEATIAALAPLFYQHVASCGASLHLSGNANLHFGYSYAFENQLSGPIVTPLGALANSNVTTHLSVHAASLGISVLY